MSLFIFYIVVKACIDIFLSSVNSGSGASFLRYETWGLIFLLFVALFAQLAYMNSGLARYDALRIVPIYQVCLKKN